MIQSFINFIQAQIIPLGGWGVFIASILEEVITPIPSALVILGSGFLLIPGGFSWFSLLKLITIVVLPAALGVTIGSLFIYTIAYYAGKPVLEKWGKWLGISWSDVTKLQDKFSKGYFDEVSLVIVRSIPLIPTVAVTAFCGLVRFPLKTYLICTFIGSVIRSAILGFIGWQVGELYVRYAKIFAIFENVILVLIVLGLATFLYWRLNKKGENKEKNKGETPV